MDLSDEALKRLLDSGHAKGIEAPLIHELRQARLQLREVRKDAWEHCVRIIEAPIQGLEELAKMTGDKRGLAAEHIKALKSAATSVRESQQFIAALEKQKTEKRICEHDFDKVHGGSVIRRKCLKCGDLES